MDVTQLQMQLCDHKNAMIEQGMVNHEFLERVKDLESTMKLDKLIGMSQERLYYVSVDLEKIPPKFEAVVSYARLNQSLTTSHCAARAKNIWFHLENYCNAHDLERCVECLQRLRDEYSLLKDNLECLITLQQEIVAYGVSILTLEEEVSS